MLETSQYELDRDGVFVVRSVLSQSESTQWAERMEEILSSDLAAIKNRRGAVYAARNILDVLPDEFSIWNRLPIRNLLESTLGGGFGLVRGLFFDKHPERTWSLPWHKDMTIAVEDNTLPTEHFSKPTTKSGVPHVEAPVSVLESMLTLRLHLDDVTDENGPLEVVPGSHLNGKRATTDHAVSKVLVDAGDVLAMRPLVSHASGSSDPNTNRHRRILHFEFAANESLPDGYRWHRFIR